MRTRPSIAQSGGTQGDPNIQIQFSLQGQAPFTISLDRALPPLLAEYTIIGPGPSILSIQRSADAATNFAIFTVAKAIRS